MGKAQKKAASDKVQKNKPSRDIKSNPFEVKINKQKFDILGRKTKHDRGLPGVSRSKSIKKRTETLLKEYQSKGKTNTFIDKRFGEYDTELTEDEKMAKRFSLERQRLHAKRSIYNLNEDEDLTHYGQSLADIESFNDRPDSDSDMEEKGKLSAEFTAAAHFGGGGLLQKKASSKSDEEEQKPKSRRDFIEELIIKSKKEKHERQVQRDKAQELTEKLDKDWKEIHSLLAQKGPKIEPVEEKPKAGDYDIIVRELFFDAKAPASDRLKTKEELAKEEQERLQKLEMERLRRMRGDFEDKISKTQKHMSADDLNDGFILDKIDKPCLVYKDGKLEQPEEEEEEQGDENDQENREDGDSDEAEDGENVDSDEDEDEENESDEDEENNESDEDDYSDLGDEDRSELDSESGSEQGKGEGEDVAAKSIPRKERAPSEEARKAMMEAAKAELPFTFSDAACPAEFLQRFDCGMIVGVRGSGLSIPETAELAFLHTTVFTVHREWCEKQEETSIPKSYEDLKSLLAGQDAEKQCLIVERIRKSNHPSVAAENKAKLENFFGFLWGYVGELATRQPAELEVIDGMVPQLYDLSQMFPEAACNLAQSTLRQSMQELEDQLRAKGRACFPKLDKLIYLKITGALFPTSDFRHPVVTPALVHLSQMLTKCSVTSLREVAAGLFACCLFLDFVSFSKRFIPEVISFLLGILHLAVPSKDNLEYTVIPPFKAIGKFSDLLVQKDKKAAESWEMKPLPMSWMQGARPHDELQAAHFRFTCVTMCFNLCKKCCSLYRTLPAFQEIIQPLEKLLASHLPVNDYPAQLQELYHEVLREIRDRPSCYQPLTFEKKKPVPLRFFTPKIVEVTDYGRKRGSTQQERERMRLIHKHKREFKGAIREIRKDTQFLARQKLSDIMQRDSERKRKVQMLMGSLATQEGEWKAMKRMKKKL